MERFRLSVRDFQIVESADLEAEGVTCVVGPSNSGKTALYRAMDACLYNRAGDDFVREPGGEAARVLVEFADDDPLSVAWKKPRGRGAEYRIDGGPVLSTVGRGPVDEVVSRGLEPFDTRRDSYRLNFWQQGTLFLVDEPETRVFDLVSELMVEKELVPVLAEMKADCTELKRSMAAAEKSLEGEEERCGEIEAELERLRSVDAEDPGAERFRADLLLAASVAEAMRAMTDAEARAATAEDAARRARDAADAVAAFLDEAEPEAERAAAVAEIATRVASAAAVEKSASEAHSRASRAAELLAGIDGWLEELEDAEALMEAAVAVDMSCASERACFFALTKAAEENSEVEAAISEIEDSLGTCEQCGAPTIDGRFAGE